MRSILKIRLSCAIIPLLFCGLFLFAPGSFAAGLRSNNPGGQTGLVPQAGQPGTQEAFIKIQVEAFIPDEFPQTMPEVEKITAKSDAARQEDAAKDSAAQEHAAKGQTGKEQGAAEQAAKEHGIKNNAPPSPAATTPGQAVSAAPAMPVPATPERRILLAIRLTPSANTYIYAPYSRAIPAGKAPSTGLPTSISLHAEKALQGQPGEGSGPFYPIFYPPGQDKKDRLSGHVTPVYDHETVFFTRVSAQELQEGLLLKASGLLCTPTSCTPFKQEIPVKNLDVQALVTSKPEKAPAWLPVFLGPLSQWPEARAELTDAQQAQKNLEAQLEANRKLFERIAPSPFQAALEVESLLEAVLFGLLAGLILNLMPCVLPVISLKLTVFSSIGGMERDEKQRSAFRQYNLFFSLGIMTWFTILLIVLGTAGMLWGQFFQSRELVITLALILFLLALSMFGIFNLPVFDIKFGTTGSQGWQAFSSGLLATLLATPCSGPLLGGVLGWAMQQSLPYLGASILSVGLGMSTPFLLMALKPGLVRILPRSGPWAITLERVIGFMLLGTVLYLLNTLPVEVLPPLLASMLFVAVAAWCWGQLGGPAAGRLKRRLARILAAAMVVLALWWGIQPQVTETRWESYNEAAFMQDLGKVPMLVEFTADWCPNCKALEYAVLIPRRLERWQERYGLRYVRVDLTRDNPEGNALLKKLNSSSIPLLAIFPTGEGAASPIILRDLVSPSQLKDALKLTLEDR